MDTRSATSISGAKYIPARFDTAYSLSDAWLSSDPYANRCVLLTNGEPPVLRPIDLVTRVDAYAYTPLGNVTQHSQLLRVDSIAQPPTQVDYAVWWKNTGLLLDANSVNREGNGSAFTYPLR